MKRLRTALLGFMAAAAAACATAGTAGAPDSRLKLTAIDAETSLPTPCRVHLSDAQGKPVRARGLPFWYDHFVCDGTASFALPPGEYRYVVERGPEYFAVTGSVTAVAGQTTSRTNELRRLANLAREGWWCGETHVHRPLADVQLLMRAEDLHLAGVQTWWNDANPWKTQSIPSNTVVHFDGDRFYDLMSGEDERGGGALLYFGLKSPLPIAGSKREYPSAIRFLRLAKQGAPKSIWVDIEKPFWWDTPIWLASGLVDSAGIAHNHMNRSGVLDNEAWGKPRERAKYPPAWGNGLYTQDIYYHILNCGLRIPPSAGSASGVLPNPVGYNRAYVHVEGDLTPEKWWEGLRKGRVFVGNGPLLRVRANGQLSGHVFKSQGPLTVSLEGRLDSRDPIAAVELVRNGQVERVSLPGQIRVEESGWFLVRAIASVTNTFRFASTGPWYVEIAEKPFSPRRESAQFFLDWLKERRSQLTAVLTNVDQREEVLGSVQEAERFYERIVSRAKP